MEIKFFYKYSQDEIVKEVRAFFEEDFFGFHPELRGRVSIVITGSLPTGHYDEYSDIDCDFFCNDEKDKESIKALIKEYKGSIRDRGIPIQIHSPMTFAELKNNHLTGWENDSSLREYSRAIIVTDVDNQFKDIQEGIKKYPTDVLKEKIQWLFAESIFSFEERFVIAVKRNNSLYAHSVRCHILKLLGNALLMSEDRFPVFEKHLYTELFAANEKTFCEYISSVLAISDLKEMEDSLVLIISFVEDRLLQKEWIEKQPKDYWVYLRPKYQVQHCS